MRVSELMTLDPIFARSNDTVAEALETMYSNDIRHLPVVGHGRLIGIVSDRDLRGLFFPNPEVEGLFDMKRLGLSLADIMSSDPLAVHGETDIDEVIEIMLEHKVGAVPVVDSRDDSLVGIISYVDILREAQGRF